MVFSDYEVRKMGFKTKDATEYLIAECIGSFEETMNTRVITKKCRGIVKKKVVKPDGTGVLKYSMHMPWGIYTEIFGMEDEAVIDGVKTYGMNNPHKELSIVEQIFNEDDNEKLLAYPNCVVETGRARKIENGAEEVAEIECEIAVSPDEYGNGSYEALVSELTDETVATKWMTEFTPDLVRIKTV